MVQATLSNNLRYLMKLHGNLSVSELARQTKIPQPTLHHILNKTTKNPRTGALEALTNFFSLSIAQLIGTLPLSHTIPESIKSNFKIMSIPVIAWHLIKDKIQGCQEIEIIQEIIVDSNVNKNSFAVIMPDNSLEPMFMDKSVLIFDPEKKPHDRNFVIVYSQRSKCYIFNRLFIDDNEYFIKQKNENSQTELIKLNRNYDEIMATLIEVRYSF